MQKVNKFIERESLKPFDTDALEDVLKKDFGWLYCMDGSIAFRKHIEDELLARKSEQG